MCSFPHFSLTCFEISWNFAHVFVSMYYRSSSSVVTLHPSGSPSVHHFSDLASYMHWQLSWNFCLSVITLRQFVKELCLFVNLEYRKSQFSAVFSSTCFDILSWNFAHDFLLMYYRSSLSVITLRQFVKEFCLFVNWEYRKYTVFRSFLLHVLTYWAEILHMTFFWCTTEQVRVSSLCINYYTPDLSGRIMVWRWRLSVCPQSL